MLQRRLSHQLDRRGVRGQDGVLDRERFKLQKTAVQVAEQTLNEYAGYFNRGGNYIVNRKS